MRAHNESCAFYGAFFNALDVSRTHVGARRRDGLFVTNKLILCSRPRRALNIEHRHHGIDVVTIPNLQRTTSIARDVLEQAVTSRSPSASASQHVARRQHELTQDVEIVLPRVIAHVHRTTADGARGGVQRPRFISALEHIPVRQHYFTHEDGVVHYVGNVHRVTRFIRRVEIVARSRHGARLEVVNVLCRVTHTVNNAVVRKMSRDGFFKRSMNASRERRTAAVFVPERADDGLSVHLDAIHTRGG
mmetsp:Transcript_391/g.1145  ORF Transcript_391/g.1145 Transcript_391/m.1145 type:complete len:247 (+) Transcript_391:466-1206(+)